MDARGTCGGREGDVRWTRRGRAVDARGDVRWTRGGRAVDARGDVRWTRGGRALDARGACGGREGDVPWTLLPFGLVDGMVQ